MMFETFNKTKTCYLLQNIDEVVKIKINKINYAFHKYEKLVTLHHVK